MTVQSQLVQALISSEPQQYRKIHQLIVLLGTAAVADLLEAVHQARFERDQWRILLALVEIGGDEVVPAMISFLHSPSSAIRALVAQFLGKAQDSRAVEPMIDLIGECDPNYTLMWAVQALGQLGDKRAVDPLLQFLKRTESTTERYMSIEALGLLGDPKAVPEITCYAFDKDHHVRDRVQIALRRLNGDGT